MNSNGNCENLKSMARSSRLIRFKTGLANSQTEMTQTESLRTRSTLGSSPIRPQSVAYDRRDRTSQSTMVQDVLQMKIMLIKLKRILDTGEDEVKNSEDEQNGTLNGVNCANNGNSKELNKQILYLQNELIDRDKTIGQLQEQISSLILINEKCLVNSRSSESRKVNVGTQTKKSRPLSMGPLVLHDLPPDASLNYFPVERSQHDEQQESTLRLNNHLRKSLPRLWRKSKEHASSEGPNIKNPTSHIPRRAKSHSRSTSTPV